MRLIPWITAKRSVAVQCRISLCCDSITIPSYKELINPMVIGVLATLHDTRVTVVSEILYLLKGVHTLLCDENRIAVTKKERLKYLTIEQIEK